MFGWKKRHADVVSPAQVSSLINFAAAEFVPKSPTERHADTLASAIQNLRDKIANLDPLRLERQRSAVDDILVRPLDRESIRADFLFPRGPPIDIQRQQDI